MQVKKIPAPVNGEPLRGNVKEGPVDIVISAAGIIHLAISLVYQLNASNTAGDWIIPKMAILIK
ncbi:hypothetical protein EOI87_16305 [Salmonella enterica]|nr:hypothetical protein [Salmonella enterica]MIV19174.1 hypothetical protein [Salmonella enterica]